MVATPTSGPADADRDQRVYLHAVPWSHYEILLAVRGEAPVPRTESPAEARAQLRAHLGRQA